MTEKFVEYKELAPKKSNSGDGKMFTPIQTVLDKPLVIQKFEWSSYNDDPVLLIYSDRGVIRTGSTILMNQVKDIEDKLKDSSLKAKIVARVNKRGKTYYSLE